VARIRTIKPEFFTSEDIVERTPLARLLYEALWCESDREGRMVWKPKTFKMRYFPADDCDIDALCQELIDAKLVELYGDGYAWIPTFKAHQHINPREAPSQLPEPTRQSRVGTRQSRDSDVQGGREGKGKEDIARQKRALPDDWIPADKTVTDLSREFGLRVPEDVSRYVAAFRDACKANGYTYKDFDAAFRNCVRQDWPKLRGGAASMPKTGGLIV
jgi:hypothetical protein